MRGNSITHFPSLSWGLRQSLFRAVLIVPVPVRVERRSSGCFRDCPLVPKLNPPVRKLETTIARSIESAERMFRRQRVMASDAVRCCCRISRNAVLTDPTLAR